jgi:hypothetical protein
MTFVELKVIGVDTKVCPGTIVEFEAVFDPPDSATGLAWELPLSGLEIDEDGIHARARFRFPGETTVKATTIPGGISKSKDITVFGVGIVLDPDFQDRFVVISDQPALETIRAKAVGIGGGVTAARWRIESVFAPGDDCFPMSPPIGVRITDFPQANEPEITIDFGGMVRGGRFTIIVEAVVGGCGVTSFVRLGVVGTNPTRSEIEAALPHRTLRAIACVESDQRQFDAPPDGGQSACPLFGPDGGVGILQIPQEDIPSDDQIWNWRENVAAGIRRFDAIRDAAKNYPQLVQGSDAFGAQKDRINQLRAAAFLDPLTITVPPYSFGDFDTDLKMLELDTIRGYDGWKGDDGFGGNEIHEFRVAMTSTDSGESILALSNVDEQTLTAQAQWERVPIKDRPASNTTDPIYVDRVIDNLGTDDGCAGSQPPPCSVKIVSSGSTLSFSPATFADPTAMGSISAVETFSAVLSGSPPPGSTIEWRVEPIDGWNGSIEFGAPPHGLTVSARARHPNKARISVNVLDGGVPVCVHRRSASVPQVFLVSFRADSGLPGPGTFDLDLERFGLRRRPSPASPLTVGQIETNALVREALIDEVVDWVRKAYLDANADVSVNVRFSLEDPSPSLPAQFITRVNIGGLDPLGRAFGRTTPGTEPNNPNDIYNPTASQTAEIYPGHLLDPAFHTPASAQLLIGGILAGLAVESPNGTPLPGQAVDDGDFVALNVAPTGPNAIRQRTVQAAIRTIGRFIARTVVHEAGHSLGLTHEDAAPGSPMDPNATFEDRTGVTAFDSTTGAWTAGDPARFRGREVRYLNRILPILS